MSTLLAPEQALAAITEASLLNGRTPSRPSVVDRIAMRVALRLLIWSTRSAGDDRSVRIHRHELAIRLAERERGWERRRHELPPLR
jgi:hypothetical protein